MLAKTFYVQVRGSALKHSLTFSKSLHISTCDSKVGCAEVGRLTPGEPYWCPVSAMHCDLFRFYACIHNYMHSVADAIIFYYRYLFFVKEGDAAISDDIRRNKDKYGKALAVVRAKARDMCGGITHMPTLGAQYDGEKITADLENTFSFHAILHPDMNFVKRLVHTVLALAKKQDDLTKRTHGEAHDKLAQKLKDAHKKTDSGISLLL